MQIRLLASVAALLFFSGCQTTQYHKERKALEPVQKFDDRFACRSGAGAAPKAKPLTVEQLNAAVEKCAGDTDVSDKQKERIQTLRALHQTIYEMLPKAWFAPKAEKDRDRTPHVRVTARNPQDKPKEKEPQKPFVTTLGDRGQSALITQLTQKRDDKALAQLESLLAKLKGGPEEKPRGAGGDPFEARRPVPLLISSSFDSHNPSDRLERMYIFIRPYEKAKIVDVEQPILESVKPVQPIAKESTVYEFSPSGAIENLIFGDARGKASTAAKIARTIERNLTKQFALRSVSLGPNREYMVIRQEGQEGIDISGNLLATITLEIPTDPGVLQFFTIDPLKDATTAPVIHRELHPMHNVGDLDAAVAWVGMARVVDSGGDTVIEEDDSVRPKIFSGQFDVNLWRNTAIIHTLRLNARRSDQCFQVPLMFFDPVTRSASRVAFRDLEQARRFKQYLLRNDQKLARDGEAVRYPVSVRWKKEKEEEKGPFEALGLGFPVDKKGNVDPHLVDLEWASGSRDSVGRAFAGLDFDVTEPADFPLRLETPGDCARLDSGG